MHYLDSIGPVLGMVAFAGLAVLAFLLFQQARDIRRLREWAGRAPERAQEAAEAVQAAAEASRTDSQVAEAPEAAAGVRARLARAWGRLSGSIGPRLTRFERRLPVDGRYLLAVAGLAAIAAAVLTSGFGFFGGEDGRKHRGHHGSSGKAEVAVLNGTPVTGLAARVDQDVIKAAGFKAGTVTNAGSSYTSTVVMFNPGHQSEAKALATAIKPKLGETPTQPMTADVEARADGAPLALALGLDDSRFGG